VGYSRPLPTSSIVHEPSTVHLHHAQLSARNAAYQADVAMTASCEAQQAVRALRASQAAVAHLLSSRPRRVPPSLPGMQSSAALRASATAHAAVATEAEARAAAARATLEVRKAQGRAAQDAEQLKTPVVGAALGRGAGVIGFEREEEGRQRREARRAASWKAAEQQWADAVAQEEIDVAAAVVIERFSRGSIIRSQTRTLRRRASEARLTIAEQQVEDDERFLLALEDDAGGSWGDGHAHGHVEYLDDDYEAAWEEEECAKLEVWSALERVKSERLLMCHDEGEAAATRRAIDAEEAAIHAIEEAELQERLAYEREQRERWVQQMDARLAAREAAAAAAKEIQRFVRGTLARQESFFLTLEEGSGIDLDGGLRRHHDEGDRTSGAHERAF